MGGLIDAKGRAISTQEIARVKRTAEMTDREGRFFHPNDGASHRGTFMRGWYANIQSADADTFWDRDTLVARARDIARNTPVGKSVTQRKVNAVVGFKWRLSPRLSARALGVTPDQARELRSQISAKFNAWAYGPTFTADAERTKTFGQVLRASAFHLVQDGEALILVEYAGDEPTKYKTRARIVDPDRLSNPAGRPNTLYLRGGVERTLNLIPWRYWIRERHPADLIGTIETFQWRPWLRHATPEGRPQVLHAYDQKRAGLTRGVTEFVACLRYMKALDKFSDATLQATTLNALQLGVIKTQSGVDAIKEGFDVEDFRGYTEDRSAWHEKNTVKLDDAAFQVLAPGDEAEMLTTARETAGFADFTRSILRLIAASLGVTYEEMTMDFSQTNYSSARAALSIAWQEILALRGLIKAQIADQLYMAWLEEAMNSGEIELPPGCPTFWDNPDAWVECEWIGPARGYIDPVKEVLAAAARIEAGTSTLQNECADQGMDWEENLEQQGAELQTRKKYGLEPTNTADAQAVQDTKNPTKQAPSPSDAAGEPAGEPAPEDERPGDKKEGRRSVLSPAMAASLERAALAPEPLAPVAG